MSSSKRTKRVAREVGRKPGEESIISKNWWSKFPLEENGVKRKRKTSHIFLNTCFMPATLFNPCHLIISPILRSMNYPYFMDEKVRVWRCYGRKVKGLASAWWKSACSSEASRKRAEEKAWRWRRENHRCSCLRTISFVPSFTALPHTPRIPGR